MPKSKPKIAILGWGSLIWDVQPQFDDWHEVWQFDGPVLPLEFSRISKTRAGALTLVIDEANGAPCTVAYAVSKRSDPEDAICDLRCREGTILKRIGFYFADGRRKCEPPFLYVISKWAAEKAFDVVIWTGLPSNFDGFSVDAVLKHLDGLSPEGKAKAAEYIRNAPRFIQTPLHTALATTSWLSGDHRASTQA